MNFNRRTFLQTSVGAGLLTAAGPWWTSTLAAPKTQYDFEDYRALVCVLFAGGMDSFNLLIPYDNDEYDAYKDLRSDLAYLKNDDQLLELSRYHTDRRFAVPWIAPELRDLFNAGELSFIANVGPLVKHMNREQFLDVSLDKPLNLESHSDQIAQWQSASSLLPLAQQNVGWLGKIADRFGNTLPNDLNMNWSLSGNNQAQTGTSTTPLVVMDPHNDRGFEELWEENWYPQKASAHRDYERRINPEHYENLLQQAYISKLKAAMRDNERAVEDFTDGLEGLDTEFDDHPWALSLKRIAQVISAHSTIDARRQTFFVNMGGWDHHEDLHENFEQIQTVSRAFKSFRDALDEVDLLDNVVLFTTSDFGRTLTSNGGGSDHGWGGNAMVLGGPIRGERVLGTYPEMSLDNKPESQLSNTDRGNFIPTTSLEEYFSELAIWFGLDVEDLELILPNVQNFIPEDSDRPEKVGIVA
ncbi:MAG: DUF1501 domain-containing protein [Gammaproteobacteria bacterium]|nr:DUF1501 domain-containing protein [Gammaproteobacteria bacterium]